MTLIDEYFQITKDYMKEYGEKTVLLMLVGSFFEVYGFRDKKTGPMLGSRIEDFSRICELNMVEKNVCVGDNKENNVFMAGFKDIQIEKYIKKLQEAGYTTVVFTQDENCKNTTRSCAGIFSPGTYFNDDSTKLSNNICCVWVDLIENKVVFKGKYVTVGVSNIDIYTGKTSLFQFKEPWINNPTTFDDLERYISIYNPSEVIFISNLNDKEADDVIGYADVKCALLHKISSVNNDSSEIETTTTTRVKNCEKQTYQREILKKFYNIHDFDVFMMNFYNNNIACQSFCFLLDFVYQHNPYLVNKISEPLFENCSHRLVLANHSLKQLNIIDDHNYSGKYSSVSKMLNHCCTAMGKRKFIYNFLNPTTSVEYLEREYQITEHLLNSSRYFSSSSSSSILKELLCSVKDMSKFERQMFLKKISPSTFCTLYTSLEAIKQIFMFIQDDKDIIHYLSYHDPSTVHIHHLCDELMRVIDNHIDKTLAFEVTQTSQFDINFIQRGIHAELDNQTKLMNESNDEIRCIKNYLSHLIDIRENKVPKGIEYVKIHETEKSCSSLVSTSRRCKILEEALPDTKKTVKLEYVSSYSMMNKTLDFVVCKKDFEYLKQSSSNNFVSNPYITNLFKVSFTIKNSMKDEITKVFYDFVETFSKLREKLECVIQFVTLIDVIYNKAVIAKKYNYCKPQIQAGANKSFVKAKELRHCLIENLNTNELYVTNDLSLGDSKTDGILLYGTNAVGKTSIIRSLGIAVIMAQSGLFVPCSEFIFSPYNYLFTRILGNDNIFKGLSTFAVEMSELRTILRLANENSLVLGDELCSGTEITSAISIFVAGIQKLQSVGSSFIFATHLHEIVDYEEIIRLPTVALKHMTVIYDRENDMLVYDRKLKDGPGNSMYGLEVCKSLKLPEDFLQNAFSIRMKYHPEEGSLLSLKTSHFNTSQLISTCEKCGKRMGTEVHHLQHQKESNEDGIIKKNGLTFHKNHVANLATLCESCHDEIHKKKTQHKKVKTSKGVILKEI